jgi:uncharacterized protein (TIGR00369 family)
MGPMTEIEYFFDYLSPYSYLAWRRLPALLESEGVSLKATPVLFAGLLEATGRVGPAEIPAQRRFVVRDCMRAAKRLGVRFGFPAKHPFRPLSALRLSLPDVAGERQHDVIDALWTAGWEDGVDMGDDDALVAALDAKGLGGAELLARTRDPASKAALRASTDRAIELGVFGLPTIRIGDELVWGHDRLDDVGRILRGEDGLDPEGVAELEATPAAAQRRRTGAPNLNAAARVRRIFSSAPFMTHLGVELVEQGVGWVETRLPIRPEHLQQDGFVHAGVVAALADHSAGAASGTLMTADRTPLTIEFKVSLLRPAKGDLLRCRAEIVRQGKTVGFGESEVFVGEKLVAKASVTLAVVAIPT